MTTNDDANLSGKPADDPNEAGDSTSSTAGTARTGSAAAAAASRARRIGGRIAAARPAAPGDDATDGLPTEPVPDAAAGPARDDRSGTAASSDAGRVAEPVGLGKPDRAGDRPEAGVDDDRDDDATSGGGRAGTQADESSAARRQGLLRWTPAVVLLAAAVVLAVLVVVSTHGSRWDRPSGGSARDEVLAAAKSCVVATNTYTYDKLDQFEKKGLACATGTFATQFAASVNKILKKQAPLVKQKQSLQVNTAGIIDVSHNNQWDVLIYGQISVTNTSTTTARIDPFGAVAHLKKIGGNWRISSLCSQSLGGTTDACY